MKASKLINLSGALIILLLAALPFSGVLSAGPYAPTADTYTDSNNTGSNFGSDQSLLLAGDLFSGCTASTYLWFKFSIPNTGTTIGDADLDVTFGASGAGPADVELLGSTDATWGESTLNWSNQGTYVSGLTSYATAAGANVGSTTTFTSPGLTSFLNTNQGQTVTLVVRADCNGTISNPTAISVTSLENPSGSGVSLSLRDPNAVTLLYFDVSDTTERQGKLGLTFALLLLLLVTGAILTRRYRLSRRAL